VTADDRPGPAPAAVTLRPVGTVVSTRRDPVDDGWDAVDASIVLSPPFGPEALAGLDQFSHLEVVYLFDRVDPAAVHTGSRRPRANPAWPEVGIFAQRAKDRPNRLGTTVCRLVAVRGVRIEVGGLDAIDGTPVLDLKPYLEEFGPRGPVVQPSWSRQLMARYW